MAHPAPRQAAGPWHRGLRPRGGCPARRGSCSRAPRSSVGAPRSHQQRRRVPHEHKRGHTGSNQPVTCRSTQSPATVNAQSDDAALSLSELQPCLTLVVPTPPLALRRCTARFRSPTRHPPKTPPCNAPPPQDAFGSPSLGSSSPAVPPQVLAATAKVLDFGLPKAGTEPATPITPFVSSKEGADVSRGRGRRGVRGRGGAGGTLGERGEAVRRV